MSNRSREAQKAFEDWGLTNYQEDLDAVIVFREAAHADGWDRQPLFGNEHMDSASKLTKAGFVMHTLTRTNDPKQNKYKFTSNISIWGPDGLAIPAPLFYSMEALIKATRTCPICKKDDVDTQRYSFAGRCCKDCLPEMQRIHEYPGWTN